MRRRQRGGPLALFRSPRLALAVLGFIALYCGMQVWLPWTTGSREVPAWARTLGLDRPFASPIFLAAVVLLFLSTLACLWDRTAPTLRLWRGTARGPGVVLAAHPGATVESFLAREGFRGGGRAWFRHRHALWGGWVLHLGLVVLIAGVAVQQGFHDGGAFELSEGEWRSLAEPGTVFGRERGPLAPTAPPEVSLTLLAFDPFLHQSGYAPDRASRLRVERTGEAPVDVVLDRAEGVAAGPLVVYHAIPTGLTLDVQIAGLGARSLHLRETTPLAAAADFDVPGGGTLRLGVTAERALDDPRGTGVLRAWTERAGVRTEIVPGVPFAFGATAARLVSVGRWAGFTYERSPGLPAVFAGFALVLLGAALLALPAGVAWREGEEAVRVFVTRGRDLLLAEWTREGENRPSGDKD